MAYADFSRHLILTRNKTSTEIKSAGKVLNALSATCTDFEVGIFIQPAFVYGLTLLFQGRALNYFSYDVAK